MRAATTLEVRSIIKSVNTANPAHVFNWTNKTVDPNMRTLCFEMPVKFAEQIKAELIKRGFNNPVYTTQDRYIRVRAAYQQ